MSNEKSILYHTYGKTGETVSALGMGGMRFGQEMSDAEAADAVRFANELGVTYFDTAPTYCADRSEAIYGRAFTKMPTNTWSIATKGFNTKTADEITGVIENSLRKLKVDVIPYFFLWCIITEEQFEQALLPGRALEGIQRAKEKGLVKHIGVSTHTRNETIKKIVETNLFEFIMVPYNALNAKQREEGLRYAKEHNMGTAAMNPLHGGVIATFGSGLHLFGDDPVPPVELAMRFCLESPYIDVTLSGMSTKEMIQENVGYAKRYNKKVSHEEQARRSEGITNAFENTCTSCGYCLPSCDENIDIRSYMELYNLYAVGGSEEDVMKRMGWSKFVGPLHGKQESAADCVACGACEDACTQYIPIRERLSFLATLEARMEAARAKKKATKE